MPQEKTRVIETTCLLSPGGAWPVGPISTRLEQRDHTDRAGHCYSDLGLRLVARLYDDDARIRKDLQSYAVTVGPNGSFSECRFSTFLRLWCLWKDRDTGMRVALKLKEKK